MAFCSKEKQLIDGGSTTIDNKFIINYLPDAPDVRSAVYLLGLALSESDGTDNSVTALAQKLGITEQDVMDAYAYWEELGLVHVTFDNPPRIVYLSSNGFATALKKVNPSKYSKFSKEMQNVIDGRMITVNEYNEYYTFLENTTFDPMALVAVAKYCVELKGNDIGYPYILTVARNQLQKGATTLPSVQDNLNSQQKYDDDLKIVFKNLKISRTFDHEDREMYDKWNKMGFSLDVIATVAKSVKTGGMKKLDGLMNEYYKHNALSLKEIEDYVSGKEKLFDTAKEVTKCLGLYYQSLDIVIEEYVMTWMAKGFDRETLVATAKYAFRTGVRTLQGFNGVIEKLHKNGVTTLSALEEMLETLHQKDGVIKQVLQNAGVERNVTQSDRNLFATWTNVWRMPVDVINFVAEKSAGTTAPMSYVNRVLADFKQNGVTTLEQAQKHTALKSSSTATTTQKLAQRHEYTDEELCALFTVLDESEE